MRSCDNDDDNGDDGVDADAEIAGRNIVMPDENANYLHKDLHSQMSYFLLICMAR